MAKQKTEEKVNFKELIEKLNKEYSGNVRNDYFDLSTGSISLDIALGGGIRSGRITELIAWEGAGKTTLCLHLVAEAQKRGLNVCYIDSEHALDKKYAEAIGCNWENMNIFQPMSGEEAFDYGRRLLETGELHLLIYDSTSGMLPKSQMDSDAGGSNMGKHALLFSKEVPKINIAASKNNAIVVFISQIREKIGVMFGSPETTQAGNTLKFFASNRIDLRKSLIKEGEEIVGQNTKFKILKCKTAKPFVTGAFPIVFGKGIDRIAEIIDLATSNLPVEKFKKWGSQITYNGEKYTLDVFKELLSDNPEFYNQLKEDLIPVVKLEESTPE